MPGDPNTTQERYEGDTQERSWDANVKRTYDEYQEVSLESIKRNRTHVDKVLSDAQQYDNQRQVIANQALQNAVTHQADTNAQKVRHADIAIENQWESGAEISGEAILAALAAAIAEKLSKENKG